MDNSKTGILIFERRKLLGMTQQELAEKLQITNKAVSKWENGDGMPDVSLLRPLAAALGVSVDELLDGEMRKTDTKAAQEIASEAEKQEAIAPEAFFAPNKKHMSITIVTLSFLFYYLSHSIYQAISYLVSFFTMPSYRPTGLLVFIAGAGSAVYVSLFICIMFRLLYKNIGIYKPRNDSFSIILLVGGIPLSLIAGMNYIAFDYLGLPFLIGLCVLFYEYQGYRLGFKICYWLTLLWFLAIGIFEFIDCIQPANGEAFYDYKRYFDIILAMKLLIMLIFWIFLGLSIKLSEGKKPAVCS